MSYSEASYFDGYHFAHIAAYHEFLRIRARDAACLFTARGDRRDRGFLA